MKIMASGDHHFDEHSRFAEAIRVHSWMVDAARDESIDLFVSGGDVYEGASSPVEREAVAEWLTRMAEVCPVVVSKGNHDRSRDCALLSRLRTKHPVIVEERAAVHFVAGSAIAAVAWPERAHILAASGGASSEATDQVTQEALRGVLRGLGDELAGHSGPRILLGHFMCDGAETSTGQPLIGQPIRVSLSDLALAQAHLTVMGHIHLSQLWRIGDAPVLYTGSPFRTDFGQTERKMVHVAEFRGSELLCMREIDTPATPMELIEARFVGEESGAFDIVRGSLSAAQHGAEVRLRYSVESDRRMPAKAAAEALKRELLSFGAVYVKTEEVVTVHARQRAPELAKAVTLEEKLSALWDAKRLDVAERKPELFAKVKVVESEVREAS